MANYKRVPKKYNKVTLKFTCYISH